MSSGRQYGNFPGNFPVQRPELALESWWFAPLESGMPIHSRGLRADIQGALCRDDENRPSVLSVRSKAVARRLRCYVATFVPRLR